MPKAFFFGLLSSLIAILLGLIILAPSWSLPLLALSSFLERFNIFIDPPGFSLKLFLILLPAVFVSLGMRGRLSFNPTFLLPYFLLLAASDFLSTIFSFDIAQSFQATIYHLLMIFAFYLFVWSASEAPGEGGGLVPRSPAKRGEVGWEKVRSAFVLGAYFVGLYGLWQIWRFAGGEAPYFFWEKFLEARSLGVGTFTTAWGALRPSMSFIDVNAAAGALMAAFFLGAPLVFAERNKHGFARISRWRKATTTLILTFLLLMIVATFSRSAFLGLAVGAVFFLILNFRWFWERVWGRMTLIAAILTAAAIFSVGAYLTFSPGRYQTSDVYRLKYARAAIQMFLADPLTGIGVGNFENYYTKVIDPEQKYAYTHSVYLTWLSEGGIPGFLANLLLLLVVLVYLLRELLRHPYGSKERWDLSGLGAAWVGLIFANIFYAYLGIEFTWVVLGLLVSRIYLARSAGLPRGGVEVLGVRVDDVTLGEAVENIKDQISRQRPASPANRGERGSPWATRQRRQKSKIYIVTPNPEMIMAAQDDPELAEVINGSFLSVPDGVGVVWAARYLGKPLKERVTGTDLTQALLMRGSKEGWRVFFLGGREGVGDRAAKIARRKYPGLAVVGTYEGDGLEKGDGETVDSIWRMAYGGRRRKINKPFAISHKPIDLLFVAYGHGKQEKWIARNLSKVPVKAAVGVGGAFDYLSGKKKRAPAIIQILGLEWLYRLILEPWRLKRQLSLIRFVGLVLKKKFG